MGERAVCSVCGSEIRDSGRCDRCALGMHVLPGSLQSPTGREPVDKSSWRPCAACGRAIPVEHDDRIGADGRLEASGSITYVCPFCGDGRVGMPRDFEQIARQEKCFECRGPLQGHQCSACRYPRGWMKVACPFCANVQPVFAPHWVDGCDLFTLQCVACESTFVSLCIC